MRVLFFGTPEIAVGSLRALVEANYEVVGVVTQTDKPQGRKMVLTAPPVKEYALQNGLPVFQPETLKNEAFLPLLQKLKPDVIVVIAYGKKLPKYVLDYPKHGCINIHASLLPHLRGAGPIQWSIIGGDEETGVTTMYMAEGIDTGDMILKLKTPIDPEETAGELYDRMSELAAESILKTLDLVQKGTISAEPQKEEDASYAPMLDKKMAELDFSKAAQELKNQIRGMNPWPVAHTFFEGKKLKFFSASVKEEPVLAPGYALGTLEGLAIGCGDGKTLVAKHVQLEGSRAMEAASFLAGHPIKTPKKLGE